MSFAPLLMEGLTAKMIETAEKELHETIQIRMESLQKIRKLIEQEPEFYPCMDDQFLLMFLRCKKHDVQRAFKTLRNYYLFKERYSRVFTDFLPSEFKNVMDANCYTNMSVRDSEGRNVCIFRLGECRRKEVSIEELFAAMLTMGILISRIDATSVCGFVVIIDFGNFPLEQFIKFASPKLVIFLLRCVQDCYPWRLREIHLVNEPPLFNIFYNIVKFVLSKKLRDRINMHGTNLEELHKYCSPEILPEELGGTRGPMNSTEFYNYGLSLEPFFKEMIKCGFHKKPFVKS